MTTIDYDDIELISENGDIEYQIDDALYERERVLLEAYINFSSPIVERSMTHEMDIDDRLDFHYRLENEYDEYREKFKNEIAQKIREKFKNEIAKKFHKKIFLNQIAEELIAVAMHPNRIQKMINQ